MRGQGERKRKEEKPVGGRVVGVVTALGNCMKSHWPFRGAGANCPPKNGLRAESLLWLLSWDALMCVCVCVHVCCTCVCAHAQLLSCVDFSWPHRLYVAHQAPLSMGLCRREYWSGLACPPPGDLPNPGVELAYLALVGRFLTTSATREAPRKEIIKVKWGHKRRTLTWPTWHPCKKRKGLQSLLSAEWGHSRRWRSTPRERALIRNLELGLLTEPWRVNACCLSLCPWGTLLQRWSGPRHHYSLAGYHEGLGARDLNGCSSPGDLRTGKSWACLVSTDSSALSSGSGKLMSLSQSSCTTTASLWSCPQFVCHTPTTQMFKSLNTPLVKPHQGPAIISRRKSKA